MLLSARTARRAVAGAIGTGAVAGVMLFGALPSAMAESRPTAPPRISPVPAAGVSKATSEYLFTTRTSTTSSPASRARTATRFAPRWTTT